MPQSAPDLLDPKDRIDGHQDDASSISSVELIKDEFERSSSLVTFSRFQTTIGNDKKNDEFTHLMNELQIIDKGQEKDIIWAIDFGIPFRGNEPTRNSQNAYRNFEEFSKICRKANRELDGNWFAERSVFFIHCTDADILKRYYLSRKMNPDKSILKNAESSKLFDFSLFNMKDDFSTDAVTAFVLDNSRDMDDIEETRTELEVKYYKHRADENGQPIAVSLDGGTSNHDEMIRKFALAARALNSDKRLDSSEDIFLELLNANFLTCNFEEFIKFEQKLRNNNEYSDGKLEA